MSDFLGSRIMSTNCLRESTEFRPQNCYKFYIFAAIYAYKSLSDSQPCIYYNKILQQRKVNNLPINKFSNKGNRYIIYTMLINLFVPGKVHYKHHQPQHFQGQLTAKMQIKTSLCKKQKQNQKTSPQPTLQQGKLEQKAEIFYQFPTGISDYQEDPIDQIITFPSFCKLITEQLNSNNQP